MANTKTGENLFIEEGTKEVYELNYIKGRPLDCVIPPEKGIGGVYLGNIEAAHNLHQLDALKIRSVLTLDDTFEHSYFNCKISTHKILKIKDQTDQDIFQILTPALQFIQKQRTKTNILVHCFAGVSRSPTIVLAYLMAHFKLPLPTALEYLKSKRAEVQPNRRFIFDLRRFEKFLGLDEVKSGDKLNFNY